MVSVMQLLFSAVRTFVQVAFTGFRLSFSSFNKPMHRLMYRAKPVACMLVV